jgi:hypothetical protein
VNETQRAAPAAPDTVLRRLTDPPVCFVEVDGETVAYDAARDGLHLLDRIGTLVWNLLDGRSSLRSISTELAEAFDQPQPWVLGDVIEFASRLEHLGLAERIQ